MRADHCNVFSHGLGRQHSFAHRRGSTGSTTRHSAGSNAVQLADIRAEAAPITHCRVSLTFANGFS